MTELEELEAAVQALDDAGLLAHPIPRWKKSGKLLPTPERLTMTTVRSQKLDDKKSKLIFDYDPAVVAEIKSTPGRWYDPDTKTWSVYTDRLDDLTARLTALGHQVTSDVVSTPAAISAVSTELPDSADVVDRVAQTWAQLILELAPEGQRHRMGERVTDWLRRSIVAVDAHDLPDF